MYTADTHPDDPRLTQLRALKSAVAEGRKYQARLQAFEARAFSHMQDILFTLADESDVNYGSKEFEYMLSTMHAELSTTLRVSERTMQAHFSEATTLTEEYPRLLEALSAGEIARGHTSAITRAGSIIQDETARRAYEAEMLGYAKTESINRVRQVAKHTAEKYAERDVETRVTEALKGRCVTLEPLEDGLSQLTAVLPSLQATALYDRLSQMSRLVKRSNTRARKVLAELEHDSKGGSAFGAKPNKQSSDQPSTSTDDVAPLTPEQREALTRAATDERTLMQIRADLFTDIVLTGFPTAITCDGSDGDDENGCVAAARSGAQPHRR